MLCRAFTGATTNTKKTQEISTGIPGVRRGAVFIREAPSFFLCLPTVEITDLAVHQADTTTITSSGFSAR